MGDLSPNNAVLTASWLVPATKTGSFLARTEIDLHEADPKALAAKIDEFCAMSDDEMAAAKQHAYQPGRRDILCRRVAAQVLGAARASRRLT